jgi:hypothetical protein
VVQNYSTTATYTTIKPTEPTSITYYVKVRDANNEESDSCKSVTVTWKNVAPTASDVA